MNLKSLLILPLIVAAGTCLAEEKKISDITLSDGTVLKDAKILTTSPNDAVILHSGGKVENVAWQKMPQNLRAEYGVAKIEHIHFNQKQKKIEALSIPLSATTNSEIEKEIATAAGIENSVQRLEAYDAVAKKHGLAPHSKVKKEEKGNWRITTDTSPIDDSKSVFCFLDADASVQVGYDTIKPTLIIRYKEGELDGYITYDTFLGSNTISVTLRFGRDSAEQATWGISTNHKSAFIRGDIEHFVDRLERADSLIVRLTPYSESPVTVSFSPHGIGKVKEAIRNARLN